MDFLARLFFDCGWFYSATLLGSFAVTIIILIRSLIRRSTDTSLSEQGKGWSFFISERNVASDGLACRLASSECRTHVILYTI
jgi:hypothetical protein